MSSASTKWTPDEKRRAACWRLGVKGTTVLKKLLLHLVAPEAWPDWCRANDKVVKDRVSYKKSTRLIDEPEIPDPEAMDVTYLAHILIFGSLVDEATKEHVRQVKNVRNELCHHHTESLDEKTFQELCDDLVDAFEKIVTPVYPRSRERAAALKELVEFADPAAIDLITEEELGQYLDEISQLKKRLEEAEDNNNFPTISYNDSELGKETIAGAHLINATSEDIRALTANPLPKATQNVTHNRVKIEEVKIGGLIVERS